MCLYGSTSRTCLTVVLYDIQGTIIGHGLSRHRDWRSCSRAHRGSRLSILAKVRTLLLLLKC
jgi:hypothetical protein